MTDTPTFLSLFACLKQMFPVVHYPRLRFILPQGPNEPNARLDFYFFQDEGIVHLHYRERHHEIIYLGSINSEGSFDERKFPPNSENHIFPLLHNLKVDFPTTVKSYGQRTHLCALCGQPLIDPSSLARGTTPNCTVHLLPPADLDDITG